MPELNLTTVLCNVVESRVRLNDRAADNAFDGELVMLIVNGEQRFGVKVNDTTTILFKLSDEADIVMHADGFVQINL